MAQPSKLVFILHRLIWLTMRSHESVHCLIREGDAVVADVFHKCKAGDGWGKCPWEEAVAVHVMKG